MTLIGVRVSTCRPDRDSLLRLYGGPSQPKSYHLGARGLMGWIPHLGRYVTTRISQLLSGISAVVTPHTLPEKAIVKAVSIPSVCRAPRTDMLPPVTEEGVPGGLSGNYRPKAAGHNAASKSPPQLDLRWSPGFHHNHEGVRPARHTDDKPSATLPFRKRPPPLSTTAP